MLNFDQFSELIKAGCTQDQIQLINRMMDGTEKPKTDPSPDPALEVKTDPKPEPAPTNPDTNKDPKPAPKPDPDPIKSEPAPADESETVKMLKEMLGIMQKGALNTLQQNQPKTQTAEQILASVLNP